jgi:hypothetical protein
MELEPKFEMDIEELKLLDDLRAKIKERKVKGLEGLLKLDRNEKTEDHAGWESRGDLIENSLMVSIWNSLDNLENGQRVHKNRFEEKLKELREIELRSTYVQSNDFAKMTEDHVPVFRAAVILYTLSGIPEAVYSIGALSCYYRLMDELNKVTSAEDSIGGASAGGKEVPKTAFITWWVIRAILAYCEVFENASKLVSKCDNLIAKSNTEPIPNLWSKFQNKQNAISFQLSKCNSKNSLFNKSAEINEDIWEKFDLELNDVLIKLDTVFNVGAEQVKEYPSFDQDFEQKVELLRIENIGNYTSADRSKKYSQIAQLFNLIAKKIRLGLIPSKRFLQFIIDHELADDSVYPNRICDAAELLFAADGLGRLAEQKDYHRLKAALEKVIPLISDKGRVPSHRPFDVASKGYVLHVSGAEIVNAMSSLITQINFSISPDSVRKLVNHFDDTWREDVKGWRHERGHSSGLCARWISAISIFTLISMEKMLDQQINNYVFRNFTIRQPEELKLDLTQLFYPDFGLIAAEIRETCISFDFQRLRAHIEGIKIASEDYPNFHSAILFGPPGTGKTTLVEALAKSSNVPLVVLTPSDILLSGEEKIESRAKYIFEALSMITSAVILFDEFEPILFDREETGTPQSIYQFLTPGMLPKLKKLNENAEKQKFVYVLSTNLIGSLDAAAIREGRFDEKIGVYPPDALSRLGRFYHEILKYLNSTEVNNAKAIIDEIIKSSSGRPMNSLAKKGWFTLDNNPLENTPFYEVKHQIVDSHIKWPHPEKIIEGQPNQENYSWYKELKISILKNFSTMQQDTSNSSKFALKEWMEWYWITALDKYILTHDFNNLGNVISTWKDENLNIDSCDWKQWKNTCDRHFL